jgi:hypothetical protein
MVNKFSVYLSVSVINFEIYSTRRTESVINTFWFFYFNFFHLQKFSKIDITAFRISSKKFTWKYSGNKLKLPSKKFPVKNYHSFAKKNFLNTTFNFHFSISISSLSLLCFSIFKLTIKKETEVFAQKKEIEREIWKDEICRFNFMKMKEKEERKSFEENNFFKNLIIFRNYWKI